MIWGDSVYNYFLYKQYCILAAKAGLPLGFGESLIYQVLPYLIPDKLDHIDDHINEMKDRGINVYILYRESGGSGLINFCYI